MGQKHLHAVRHYTTGFLFLTKHELGRIEKLSYQADKLFGGIPGICLPHDPSLHRLGYESRDWILKRRKLRDMDVDPIVWQRAIETPHEEIFMLSNEELEATRLAPNFQRQCQTALARARGGRGRLSNPSERFQVDRVGTSVDLVNYREFREFFEMQTPVEQTRKRTFHRRCPNFRS